MKPIVDPPAFEPAGFYFLESRMSEAMKMIVDGYVRLKDRQALEELRNHRRRLRQQLGEQREGVFDASQSIRTFDAEVLVIEAALEQLRGSAAG
jgi:hypothetical protein